jgi:hypothetical protein
MTVTPNKRGLRDTRPQDATGVNRADIITQGRARHGFQRLDARNDNGVDAIIILRKKGVDTGELIFAQVKCGTGGGYFKSTKNRPQHFGVQVGADYIKDHRPRWDKLFGPAILIYVDHKSEKAWWADLKDEQSYSTDNKQIILVEKKNRFGIHSFSDFHRLKGHIHVSPETEVIEAKRDDVNYFNLNLSPKQAAKKFYRTWANQNNTVNPELGTVIVSREGWRHICRSGRKSDRIIQSWSLLGVAKRSSKKLKTFTN